tara:strand:- start:988 stop:1668 length:681 start_codon:yes stop_codon:yes gene_type:complete
LTRLYYNPVAASGDPRRGHGYGKSQKVPSFGTGLGSMTSMGSSETGIYVEPDESGVDLDFDDDFGFDDESEIDAFVNKINGKTIVADPTFWPRADRSSLGQSGVSSAPAALALTEMSPSSGFPTARKGMVPFSNKTLYPGGFSGPPLGTGAANQAFRTTGPFKRTGTQYGSSRAPMPIPYEDNDFEELSFIDILDMSPEERAIIRQKIKILKVLNRIDEIDKGYEV